MTEKRKSILKGGVKAKWMIDVPQLILSTSRKKSAICGTSPKSKNRQK